MSVEQAKAFFDKIKEDEALGKKLADAQAAYKGDKEGAVAAVIVPVAAEAGFKFTVEEFNAAFPTGEGEASEDELEAVAGGYSCTGIGAKGFCDIITW